MTNLNEHEEIKKNGYEECLGTDNDNRNLSEMTLEELWKKFIDPLLKHKQNLIEEITRKPINKLAPGMEQIMRYNSQLGRSLSESLNDISIKDFRSTKEEVKDWTNIQTIFLEIAKNAEDIANIIDGKKK